MSSQFINPDAQGIGAGSGPLLRHDLAAPHAVAEPVAGKKAVQTEAQRRAFRMEILGAAFKELPDDLKKQLNLGYGLQVTGVSSGKMSDAGVRKGFIILKANDQDVYKRQGLFPVIDKVLGSSAGWVSDVLPIFLPPYKEDRSFRTVWR